MTEYFIRSNSFAAPFFSDQSTEYVQAETPDAALLKVAAGYKHPCGLYSAVAYTSADAFHKGEEPLSTWLCNRELEQRKLTEGLGSYSLLGIGPDEFEINGVRHKIENPKAGRIVPRPSDDKRGTP